MSDNYDEIRPYRDEEIPQIMERIANHPWVLNGISKFATKGLPLMIRPLGRILAKKRIKLRLKSIKTVESFQKDIIVKEVVERVLAKTVDNLSCSGLETLDNDKAYIFISNHRDITLDSAFLNYFLYREGYIVSEIAFGDNLLINDFVSDLIRVNRAFIVKRNLPIREQIKASIELSSYINETRKSNRSIWIAQREGRAKDGDDRTNPAVIKMIYLSQRKNGIPFSEYIHNLRIVPVAISYEFDPCDRMKAWELYRKEKKGKHDKGKLEDLTSMYAGITGYKGRIHYSFCSPLSGDFSDEKDVARAIDREIHSAYTIWPSNYIGYDHFYNTTKYSGYYTVDEEEKMIARLRRLPPDVRSIAFHSYGKPLENREEEI